MKVGSSQFFQACLAATAFVVFCMCASAPASAQASLAAANETQIGDKPGYQPTPDAEQTAGEYERQEVVFRTNEAPGTVIIHTDERFLYVVLRPNRALRYGIGVGRDGFRWSGVEKISRKEEWPDWRPPQQMIERQPYLPRFVAGGEGNPLGARALYLGNTVFRLHGTNQPETIGYAVSSGCFRLVNEDIIDLYERVPVGAKVIVKQGPSLRKEAARRRPGDIARSEHVADQG